MSSIKSQRRPIEAEAYRSNSSLDDWIMEYNCVSTN
jgi:hypothetical protein